MPDVLELNFELWPKQREVFASEAQYILYGGAAGGGKSHCARIAAITACLQIPGLQVYLFRKHYKDLIKNHIEGPTGFRAMLAPLVAAGACSLVELEIRFENQAKIHLCHAMHEKDVWNYQGAEIHFLILEEGSQLTEFQIRFLLARCRIPDALPIAKKERKKWPRILVTTNPGGPSHSYFKTHFVDKHFAQKTTKRHCPTWTMDELEGGWTAQYIPARLQDNPSLNIQQYTASLMGLRRKDLVDAMLEGRWDIPLGAMFPECDERKHVLDPFPVPRHWFKFRTFDWGSSSPAAVIWWAVSDGKDFAVPRGALLAYREWYVASPLDPTRGLALSNQQLADGIVERTPDYELMMGTVTDSKPFQANGGQTIAEDFEHYKVPLQLGDVSRGSRIQGWQLLRSRLIGINDKPMIYFFRDCRETWRTLVGLQTDSYNVEDADTNGEDHAPDAVSLACKARPMVRDGAPEKEDWLKKKPTFADVLKEHLKEKAHVAYR